MLKFTEFILEKSDDFKNTPIKALEDAIKYWQCRKYLWNKKEITLSKDDINKLKTFQTNLEKHFPKYSGSLDLKGEVLKDVADRCK